MRENYRWDIFLSRPPLAVLFKVKKSLLWPYISTCDNTGNTRILHYGPDVRSTVAAPHSLNDWMCSNMCGVAWHSISGWQLRCATHKHNTNCVGKSKGNLFIGVFSLYKVLLDPHVRRTKYSAQKYVRAKWIFSQTLVNSAQFCMALRCVVLFVSAWHKMAGVDPALGYYFEHVDYGMILRRYQLMRTYGPMITSVIKYEEV